MKILKTLLLSLTAAVMFAGCGCCDDDNYNDGLTTLFLVDKNGYSLAGVPYKCESMQYLGYTLDNGEFSFYPGEKCEFDFTSLGGNLNGDIFEDDIVYIVDDINDGKGNIGYDCELFGASTTQSDGSFYYEADDQCVFFF